MALQRFSKQIPDSAELRLGNAGRSSLLISGASRSHGCSKQPFLGAILLLCVFFVASATWMMATQTLLAPVTGHHLVRGGKYVYWGYRIDCPGRNCLKCAGLGHQESSLRCALEEALFLNRTFVLPDRLCLSAKHNKEVVFGQPGTASSHHRWDSESCSIQSLYDVELISKTVPVILESSTEWSNAVALAEAGIVKSARVRGTSREELRKTSMYFRKAIINRTANPLAWFMECGNRRNHSDLLLPYSFLPAVAAQPLREVADRIKQQLKDYDAIHVRRGDKLKLRQDRFGVYRTTYPHLHRDTQPVAISNRIKDWIPAGRTLYIASDESKPGFFDPLRSKYHVVQSSNFSSLLARVVHNNYQLFLIDRLVLAGARVVVKTWKEYPADLSLSDDPKKALKRWELPVYTFNDSFQISS